jgi:hypothetical protein
MTPAPVALFAYCRPDHLRKTLNAIRANPGAADTELFLFSDAADPDSEQVAAVEEVRQGLRNVDGFARIHRIEREKRLGLAGSILSGVSQVLETHGRVIVLEDDIVTHPAFLRYMNGALESYENDSRILSISASMPHRWRMRVPKQYPHDVWLSLRNLSTGWGTWLEDWNTVDWDVRDFETFRGDREAQRRFNRGGPDLSPAFLRAMEQHLDLWAARFSYAHFRQGKFSLLPRHSYARHIGYDGTGTNTFRNPYHRFDTVSSAISEPSFPANLMPDTDLQRRFRSAFRTQGWIERLRYGRSTQSY